MRITSNLAMLSANSNLTVAETPRGSVKLIGSQLSAVAPARNSPLRPAGSTGSDSQRRYRLSADSADVYASIHGKAHGMGSKPFPSYLIAATYSVNTSKVSSWYQRCIAGVYTASIRCVSPSCRSRVPSIVTLNRSLLRLPEVIGGPNRLTQPRRRRIRLGGTR